MGIVPQCVSAYRYSHTSTIATGLLPHPLFNSHTVSSKAQAKRKQSSSKAQAKRKLYMAGPFCTTGRSLPSTSPACVSALLTYLLPQWNR